MTLAIFDLDDTLIDGNSPSLWSEHLAQLGWVDRDSFLPREQELVALYAERRATLEEYLAHTLQPLVGRTPEEVAYIAAPFVEEVIEPLIHSDAMRCVSAHRSRGERILIISATPTFLVEAIAERLGIADVLGTDLALAHGHYSGAIDGLACARDGKLHKLEQWLQHNGESRAGAHFYSDSINDLPLLQAVDHAHAVNPDVRLRTEATERGWEILDWR